jgi:hypothetical protein
MKAEDILKECSEKVDSIYKDSGNMAARNLFHIVLLEAEIKKLCHYLENTTELVKEYETK